MKEHKTKPMTEEEALERIRQIYINAYENILDKLRGKK